MGKLDLLFKNLCKKLLIAKEYSSGQEEKSDIHTPSYVTMTIWSIFFIQKESRDKSLITSKALLIGFN